MTLDIKRILVPLDFSANSRRALDYAVGVARRFDASIHLIHVCEVPVMATGSVDAYAIAYDDWSERLGENAEMQLTAIAATMKERACIDGSVVWSPRAGDRRSGGDQPDRLDRDGHPRPRFGDACRHGQRCGARRQIGAMPGAHGSRTTSTGSGEGLRAEAGVCLSRPRSGMDAAAFAFEGETTVSQTTLDLHFADSLGRERVVYASAVDGLGWYVRASLDGCLFTKYCSDWQSVERTVTWLRIHVHLRARRTGATTTRFAGAGGAGRAVPCRERLPPALHRAPILSAPVPSSLRNCHEGLRANAPPARAADRADRAQYAGRIDQPHHPGAGGRDPRERADAKQGDFFTPVLARELRTQHG